MDGSGIRACVSMHFDQLGKPVTPYFWPKGLPSPSASTLAIITLFLACWNASASCSYLGARFLQWPLYAHVITQNVHGFLHNVPPRGKAKSI